MTKLPAGTCGDAGERALSATNFFSSRRIDRVSDRRLDDEWLAARLEDPATRFVPVWQFKNLFTPGEVPAPAWLSPDEARDLLPAAESTTLLGVDHGRTYFAVSLPANSTGVSGEGDAPAGPLAGLGHFEELRQVAALLDVEDGALLAYARAMSYWHHYHRFCSNCGSPTRSVEGGHLRVCTNERCGQKHFPRTDPAIIVLVTCGEHGLLGHKRGWPPGLYSTIAGFVEPGESLEDAVAREVGEETGVRLASMRYHSSQPWPFPTSLMLGFRAQAASDAIHVDGVEIENARWFTREEVRSRLQEGLLRLPPPISVSFHLIQDWFDAGGLGPLRDLAGH
jgi:NAD+ diphosphatase